MHFQIILRFRLVLSGPMLFLDTVDSIHPVGIWRLWMQGEKKWFRCSQRGRELLPFENIISVVFFSRSFANVVFLKVCASHCINGFHCKCGVMYLEVITIFNNYFSIFFFFFFFFCLC